MNSLTTTTAIPALLRRYSQLSDADAAKALQAQGYQIDAEFVASVRERSASFVTREAYWLDLLATFLPGIGAAAHLRGESIGAIFDNPSGVQPVLDAYPELRAEFVGLSPNTQRELKKVWQICQQIAA